MVKRIFITIWHETNDYIKLGIAFFFLGMAFYLMKGMSMVEEAEKAEMTAFSSLFAIASICLCVIGFIKEYRDGKEKKKRIAERKAFEDSPKYRAFEAHLAQIKKEQLESMEE